MYREQRTPPRVRLCWNPINKFRKITSGSRAGRHSSSSRANHLHVSIRSFVSLLKSGTHPVSGLFRKHAALNSRVLVNQISAAVSLSIMRSSSHAGGR